MSYTLWDRIENIVRDLTKIGLKNESCLIDDALKYSSSSSEIYYKISGMLNHILTSELIKDEELRNRIKDLKSEIDQEIG